MVHCTCSGWVQVGGTWALYVLHSYMSLGLVCRSCVCCGLWVDLILLRILLLVFFNLLWHGGVIRSSFFASCFFSGLGFARVWIFPSSIWPLPSLWVDWHFCYVVMLSFNLYLLGLLWAYYMLFFYSVHVAQYFCWAYSHTILSFLGPFHSFEAFAYFISLGILGQFYYYIPMSFC